jgi:hypothetical protein
MHRNQHPVRTLSAGKAMAAMALASALCLPAITEASATSKKTYRFDMVRSTAAETSGCLKKAIGKVTVTELGPVERMEVKLYGLPPRTGFDLFVLQVPDFPFGLSWYQGDIETNAKGYAKGVFQGRFNVETFIVAPGIAPAPNVHDKTPPTPDAKTNPATAPIHTLHLGLWFNDPKDAAKAGCPAVVTPFNGDHDAGVQILSTKNFPPTEGPLGKIGR